MVEPDPCWEKIGTDRRGQSTALRTPPMGVGALWTSWHRVGAVCPLTEIGV